MKLRIRCVEGIEVKAGKRPMLIAEVNLVFWVNEF